MIFVGYHYVIYLFAKFTGGCYYFVSGEDATTSVMISCSDVGTLVLKCVDFVPGEFYTLSKHRRTSLTIPQFRIT